MNLKTFAKHTLLLALGALLLAATAHAQAAAPPPKKKPAAPKKPAPVETRPALEPKAVDLLKAMSDRLAAAKTMSFTAVELFETSSRHGHPLAYTMRYQVTLQRPNMLRVIIPGDGPASEFYYDGKTMTALAPAENLIAIATAPPTIDATLEAAYNSAAIYYPFTDVIVADPYKDMAPGLELAYYIGQSHEVAGSTTDMVAYIDNGVFIQAWIGADDKLPRLIRAVFLNDPERLRHELVFQNWQLDVTVPDGTFAPSNSANAKKIAFAHPHPQPPPGAKPVAKTPATKKPATAQ
jgi:hypothetical protein